MLLGYCCAQLLWWVPGRKRNSSKAITEVAVLGSLVNLDLPENAGADTSETRWRSSGAAELAKRVTAASAGYPTDSISHRASFVPSRAPTAEATRTAPIPASASPD